MSTRVTHAISKSLDVKFWPDGGGDFQLRATGFVADLTPEQATQLRHHLTVWLEAGAQAGVGKPVVLGVDMAAGPDITVKTMHAPDGSLTHFEQLGNGASLLGHAAANPVHLLTSTVAVRTRDEEQCTREIRVERAAAAAARASDQFGPALVPPRMEAESAGDWAIRAGVDLTVYGARPGDWGGPLDDRPRWSSTPPTEPGWYWLDVPTLTGARIVEVEVEREGNWWTVTGPKVAASWQTGISAHEWGWKWWSERLTPPSVPHG
jgi:hypothetical protein